MNNKTIGKLKKCPFCGSSAAFRVRPTYNETRRSIGFEFYIRCNNCNARRNDGKYNMIEIDMTEKGELIIKKDDRLDVISEWNERS